MKDHSFDVPRSAASPLLRILVASCLGAASGIFTFTAAAGLSASWLVGIAFGVLGGALATWQFWKHPVIELDEAACSRGLKIVSALATVGALVLFARLAVFMVAPAQAACSFIPSSDWEVRHSCVSAYFVAAEAAGRGANVYDSSLYDAPDDNPARPRKARMLGTFRIDVYEYPPAFLLLPRLLRLAIPDFLRFRAFWFGLNGGILLLAILVAARCLRPAAGTRALLLSPLIWASLPTLSLMQKGNLQGMAIALSVLAMILFERRRRASGGALLAFATVSKLFPGLLVVDLLARRKWRAVGWTAAFGIGFALLTLLDLGPPAFAHFLRHFPGLLGGEAFPAFRNPPAMAINLSVPGLVFKLKLFGLAGMSFGISKAVGWIYTVLAIWATVVLARRPLPDGEAPMGWLAILILATLRSPFLPQGYGAVPALWLLTLFAAIHAPSAKTIALTLLGCLAFNLYWPIDRAIDPRLLALVGLLPQALLIALPVLILRRALKMETSPASALAPPGIGAPAIG